MTEDTMTIREMCDAYEVTPRALRFYESKELLAPIRIGQRRLFTRRDRARLTLILRGKRFGFSLEEIRQMLDLYVPGGDPSPQIAHALELGRNRHRALLDEREELNAAIAELEEQIALGERTMAETTRVRKTG